MAFLLKSKKIFDFQLVKYARQLSTSGSIFQQNISVQEKLDNLDHEMRKINSVLRYQNNLSKADIEDVIQVLRKRDTISLNQSLSLIKACQNLYPVESPDASKEIVAKVWNEISRCYVNLDISHFNALLQVYLEIGHLFSIDNFLSDIADKGIKPNRVTYQLIIHKYCLDGNTDEAAKVVSLMKERNMSVNREVFNSFITGYNKLGDLKSAEEIITLMKQSGLEPSHLTFIQLILGHASKGNVEEIENIILKYDISLNQSDSLKVVYELFNNGHTEAAVKHLCDSLQSPGLKKQSDFRDTCIRLINSGKKDEAITIIKTLAEENTFPDSMLEVTEGFLIQMSRIGHTLPEILDVCLKFHKEGWSSFHTESILHNALQEGDTETAIRILDFMAEHKLGEIRSHYTWPLFVQFANQQKKDEFDNLRSKLKEWNVDACEDTSAVVVSGLDKLNYPTKDIMPFLEGMNDKIIGMSALASHYLPKEQFKKIIDIGFRHHALLNSRFISDLIPLYLKTNDAQSIVNIFFFMLKSDSNEKFVAENQTKVNKFIDLLKRNCDDIEKITPILEQMEKFKIGLPQTAFDMLKEKFGQEPNEQFNNMIENLKHYDTSRKEYRPVRETKQAEDISLEDTIKEFELRQGTDQPSNHLFISMVVKAMKEKDLDVLASVIQKNEMHIMKAGLMMRILLLLIEERPNDALIAHEQLRKFHPDFNAHFPILMRLAQLLAKENKTTEALKLISEHLQDRSEYKEDGATFKRCINSVTNEMGENGSVEDVRELNNILKQKDFHGVNIDKFEIIELINSGDLRQAVDHFKSICESRRIMPAKHELQVALIQKEDSDLLQEVIELAIGLTGEMRALHDMAISFLCTGRKLQAEKIFKSTGMQADNFTLEQQCLFLVRQKNAKVLEDLIDVTRDLFNCDRNLLYDYLLRAYAKEDNVDKVEEIWTNLQTENTPLSNELITSLSSYLRSKNRILPFMVEPEPKPKSVPVQTQQPKKIKEKKAQPEPKEPVQLTENYKELLKDISKMKLNENEDFKTFAMALKEKLLLNVTTNNHSAIIRLFINQLADKSDLDSLNSFNGKFKGVLNAYYDRAIARCYLESNRIEDLVSHLESINITPETQYSVSNMMNYDFHIKSMEQQHLLPRVMSITEKLAAINNYRVYDGLATVHLLQNNIEEAEKALSLIKDQSQIRLNHLINTCYKDNNEEPLLTAAKITEKYTLNPEIKKDINSAIIKLFIRKGKIDEAKEHYTVSKEYVTLNEEMTKQLESI